ncbi:Beta-lactamase [metagenome]|uniref:Beta-lactamase n=1 Tax=metagenome TaxID=256318 RepID=A0A2P2CDM2_9ZZZZ
MTQVADTTARRLLVHLATAQSAGRVPSLVAGVVRDGSLVWSGAYGDSPASVTDTQYRIGSITKTLTAVLILQLVRDGRLSLDAAARSVLGDVGYADRTIRSLLAHTSGMPSEPVGSWWERSSGRRFDELVHANPGDTAAFPAHQRFHYSNLGFALLGEVAARLHGVTWWEAVQGHILAPLGMGRTTYLPQQPAATGYSVQPYTGELMVEPATDTGAMAPAGQIWSTITDLATYAAFLVDGHAEVLSAAELELAFTPQSGEPRTGLGYAHALGFQLFPGGSGTVVGHTGSMPGFLASCLVDPQRRSAAVVLANATSGLAPADLAIALLEELEHGEPTLPAPWRPSEPVPDLVADALGVWHWGNTPFVFAWEGDHVVVRRDGAERHRFAVRQGRMVGVAGYHAGEELKVIRNADGTVNHLDVATFIHTRTPYDPAAPIPGG